MEVKKMAMEYRTMDVDNEQEVYVIEILQFFGWKLKSSQRVYNQSSKPQGAITYENLTFIHSETNTVDFTKLVFERDKNIPHYDELVVLEEEFFALAAEHAKPKPYMPPDVHTMEEWAVHFYPDLRTPEEKRNIHIGFGIAMAIWVICLLSIGESADSASSGIAWLTIGGAALIGWLWYHTLGRRRSRAFKMAMKPEKSAYRSELQKRYENVMKEIEAYERYEIRMGEIRERATSLLND